MAEFRLSPAAQRDLDAVFDYTVQYWGVAQAVRYTQALETACAEFAEEPARGQDCGHIRVDYRRFIAEQHVIYFRVTDYGIAVIRILHGRMEASRHL